MNTQTRTHTGYSQNLQPCFPVAYDIEYKTRADDGDTLSVSRVIFERWNDAAKINEEVSIHWTQAFQWADANPAGGTVVAVITSDGKRRFASARHFNANHASNGGRYGMSAVHVGCYGSAWLTRRVRQAEAVA